MNSKNEKREIRKIAEKYNLSLILLFGSQVNGKKHVNSDLDLAVLPKKNLNFKKYFGLISDLSKIFQGEKIDLVSINKADPLLLKKILENYKLLCGSRRNLCELKIYSFKKYCDYKKYFDLEEKFVHKFLLSFK